MRYTLLGRSGLRVSEFALGTMTFGERMGWGTDADESMRLLRPQRRGERSSAEEPRNLPAQRQRPGRDRPGGRGDRRRDRSLPRPSGAGLVASTPGTVVPILGASRLEQLRDSLTATDLTLEPEHRESLDTTSAIELGFPHDLLRQEHVTDITYGDHWPLVDTARPNGPTPGRREDAREYLP